MKYKIRKHYCYYLEGIIEAENEKEANNIFDDTPSNELKEEYLGDIVDVCDSIEVLNG